MKGAICPLIKIFLYAAKVMALGINQVTYSNRNSVGLSVCRSVGPGFATLGTSR